MIHTHTYTYDGFLRTKHVKGRHMHSLLFFIRLSKCIFNTQRTRERERERKRECEKDIFYKLSGYTNFWKDQTQPY